MTIWSSETMLQAADTDFLRNFSRTVHLLASYGLYLKQWSFAWAALLKFALHHGPQLLTPMWIIFSAE
jgi:hypothetical protein